MTDNMSINQEEALHIWNDDSVDDEERLEAIIPHLRDLPLERSLEVYLTGYILWAVGLDFKGTCAEASRLMREALDGPTSTRPVLTLFESGEADTEEYQLFRVTVFAATVHGEKLVSIRQLDFPREQPTETERVVVRSAIKAGGLEVNITHADFFIDLEHKTLLDEEFGHSDSPKTKDTSSWRAAVPRMEGLIGANKEELRDLLQCVSTGVVSPEAFLYKWFLPLQYASAMQAGVFKFMSALKLIFPALIFPPSVAEMVELSRRWHSPTEELIETLNAFHDAPPELWKVLMRDLIGERPKGGTNLWEAVNESVLASTYPCNSISWRTWECLGLDELIHECGEPPGPEYSTEAKKYTLRLMFKYILEDFPSIPSYSLPKNIEAVMSEISPNFHEDYIEDMPQTYAHLIIKEVLLSSVNEDPFTAETLYALAPPVDATSSI